LAGSRPADDDRHGQGESLVCARLIPADVKVSIERTYGGLDATDYAILKAIREAIPAANSRTPEEVLAYVRDTLMAADAKVVIDANEG
jgi:hypothetical protein